jgi:protein ImuA
MGSWSGHIDGVFRLHEVAQDAPSRFPLGLGEAGVHELCEARFGDFAALTGFALAACRTSHQAVLWIAQSGLEREHGRMLHHGLQQGFAPELDIICAHPRHALDGLWMVEEAIKSAMVGLVVAEIGDADFTATRRLSMASARHDVPVVLLMPYSRHGATAAHARWRVQPRLSAPNPLDLKAPGLMRWRATLERSRMAPHRAGQDFDLEWNDETLSLHVASPMAPHKTETRDRETGRAAKGHRQRPDSALPRTG